MIAVAPGPLVVTALRHVPRGRGALDFQYAAASASNRWNDQGVPTVYLAAGADVCIAEYARHLGTSAFGPGGRASRDLYAYDVTLHRVLDLTSPATTSSFGVVGPPAAFLDKNVCRRVAREARAADPALEALLAPSIAFLDDTTRWSLVVFLDRISPAEAFPAVRSMGALAYRRDWRARLLGTWERVRNWVVMRRP